MTHFFHWDGIYVTYQTLVSRSELKEGGEGGGEEDRKICEFNYASIVFTVQKNFFGNIWGLNVEPAASETFGLETASRIIKRIGFSRHRNLVIIKQNNTNKGFVGTFIPRNSFCV